MNILLCGLPCCGKTTMGLSLAKKTALSFVDTDTLLEKQTHLSCRELFLQRGEEEFRILETKILKSLPQNASLIISLGGGCVDGNEDILKELGSIVYLKTSLDIIWERLLKRGLPAYLDKKDPYNSFIKLAQKRTSLYESIANITIDTDHLKYPNNLKNWDFYLKTSK